MKTLLLCLGAGIPFGLWSYMMAKSGIQNPALTATILLLGSLIPFLPILSFDPKLKPGVTLSWALGAALATCLIHGIGHRFYQYLIVNNGRDGISLDQVNITIFMVMLITMTVANVVILKEPLDTQRALAIPAGVLTILLYGRFF